VKLLRFLQDGEYRSVGSAQIRHANIRVIAAANAYFTQILRSGEFREDLFYRLSVLTLTLPPLRERPGDILLLTRDFLAKQAAITNTRPKIFPSRSQPPACSSVAGNVRELQNVLMRAIVLSDRCEIELSDLNLPRTDICGRPVVSNNEIACRLAIRAHFLTSLLHAHRGNITRAALAAKKTAAFWQLLRKHALLPRATTRRHLLG